jgi:predicted transcriptional regulator
VPRPKATGPTDGELAILRVLWDQGPSTVKQIHDVLRRKSGTGYTTTLKLLQIMTEKGSVQRDESERTHVYRCKKSEQQVLRQLTRSLLNRAFKGSTHKLVMHALSTKKASPDEIAEIRKLLDDLEGGRK